MGIRQERPMCITLVEHFVRKMIDEELNSFDNAQTGTVVNWDALEMISIYSPLLKMSDFEPWMQMATSSACIKVS